MNRFWARCAAPGLLLWCCLAPVHVNASSLSTEPVFLQARPSPKGDRMAVTMLQGDSRGASVPLTLAVAPMNGGTLRRITAPPYNSWNPHWLPDGETLLFLSDRLGTPQLYSLRMDGPGEARPLTSGGSGVHAFLASPSGKSVAWLTPRPEPPETSANGMWRSVKQRAADPAVHQLWVASLGREGTLGPPRLVLSELRMDVDGTNASSGAPVPVVWGQLGKAEVLLACRFQSEASSRIAVVHPKRLADASVFTEVPFLVLGLQPGLGAAGHVAYGIDAGGRLVAAGFGTTPVEGGGARMVPGFGSPWEHLLFLGEARWASAFGETLTLSSGKSELPLPLPSGAFGISDMQLLPKAEALLVTLQLADGTSSVGRVRLNRPTFQQLLPSPGSDPKGASVTQVSGRGSRPLAWSTSPPAPSQSGRSVAPSGGMAECIWLGHGLGASVPALLLVRALLSSGRPCLLLPAGSTPWLEANTALLAELRGKPVATVWVGASGPPAGVNWQRREPQGPMFPSFWATWAPQGKGPQATCPSEMRGCYAAPVGLSGIPAPGAFEALLSLPEVRAGLGIYP